MEIWFCGAQKKLLNTILNLNYITCEYIVLVTCKVIGLTLWPTSVWECRLEFGLEEENSMIVRTALVPTAPNHHVRQSAIKCFSNSLRHGCLLTQKERASDAISVSCLWMFLWLKYTFGAKCGTPWLYRKLFPHWNIYIYIHILLNCK